MTSAATAYSYGRKARDVSQAIASAYWPDGPAVGATLIREGTPPRPYSVIGVVADTRMKALDDAPTGEIYESLQALTSVETMTYFVAFAGDPSKGLQEVVAAIQRRHPEIAASRSQLVDDALGESIKHRQFHTLLFASFGVSALAIVGVGISLVDGTRVATSHSTDGGQPPLSLPRGEHRIAVDLEVTLLPRAYTLDATVVRSDGYDIDSVNRVLDFTALGVAESGGDRYPWETVRGFVRPLAHWHALDTI